MTTNFDVPDVLAKIASYKRREIQALKSQTDIDTLRRKAIKQTPARAFKNRIKEVSYLRPALIAEVKKASPSKGVIRDDFDPVSIANDYVIGGAACLSVLTDGPGFQGSAEIFRNVRANADIPILRKDFMLDPIQITESRVMGADAVLVILSMISDNKARALMDEADALGMDVLVETHDESEIKRACDLGATLIGINNRNLRTFETRLDNFYRHAPGVPNSVTLIAESGIFTPKHILTLTQYGAEGFLVGESLMRADNIQLATHRLQGLTP